jgi:hypothetical protein
MIHKFFILDHVVKHLTKPARRKELRKEGRFIIEPDLLEDHKLSSQDSEAGEIPEREKIKQRNQEQATIAAE